MQRTLGSLVLVTLAIPAGLTAQDRYSLPPTAGGDVWNVADPAPLAPAYYQQHQQPPALSVPQSTVGISQPAAIPSSTAWPAVVPPPPSPPVYAHSPQLVPPPVTTYRPLVPVASPPPNYYLGHGIFGQPKLYVPEQPVRNFLRYLSF
jgi:hypothetical protein